ncbi:MAG TPA: DsrE family protein [Mycobacteriales bacterium]|jgi:Predicted peroxiredoxins
MDGSLVIKVTAGTDAPERCAQAFTVASVGVASGVPTSLWLTGEAAWFALPGRAEQFELAKSPPLGDLLGAVLAGGTVTVCTQCAARRGIEPGDVIEGIRVGGAQSFLAEVMADGAKALVY